MLIQSSMVSEANRRENILKKDLKILKEFWQNTNCLLEMQCCRESGKKTKITCCEVKTTKKKITPTTFAFELTFFSFFFFCNLFGTDYWCYQYVQTLF